MIANVLHLIIKNIKKLSIHDHFQELFSCNNYLKNNQCFIIVASYQHMLNDYNQNYFIMNKTCFKCLFSNYIAYKCLNEKMTDLKTEKK